MKVVIDVSLSPEWVLFLREKGVDAAHWTSVGDPRAKDAEIMEWAREHGCIVLTLDLDFGTILALSGAAGPSVIQIRAQDVLPASIGAAVDRVLKDHRTELDNGAIAAIDESSARVRILPILRPLNDRDAE